MRSKLFQDQSVALNEINITELLAPYLYLDETLIQEEDDGLACFKKFSNQGNGASLRDRMLLNSIAHAILTDDKPSQASLELIDLLTLRANHVDQQRYKEMNEMLPKEEKEATVLRYLEAAYKISPQINCQELESYSPRVLSTHAQLLHYLAKARRYAKVEPGERLSLLQDALTIAEYVTKLACSKEDDPHAYQGRVATYKLAVCNCLQDMGQFLAAAKLVEGDTECGNRFHEIQAFCKLAVLWGEEYKSVSEDVAKEEAKLKMLEYAVTALRLSSDYDNALLKFNARVGLMNALQATDSTDEASEMANQILIDMENPDSGAKPLHREAAQKVLDANQMGVALRP